MRALLPLLLLESVAAAAQLTAPSSSSPPYLAPIAPGVRTVALLTVGDSIGGYPLVGSPDGMGARALPNGRFELLVNHELEFGAGVAHAHGARGAFVSRWEIDAATLTVAHGEDLIREVHSPGGSHALARLCSGDLPAPIALWLQPHGAQTPDVFLGGEELFQDGRAFAHVVTGPLRGHSYELRHMGNASWENIVARPFKSELTVVIGLDDASPGQVYVYVGRKRRLGNVLQRAGLVGGLLYGVRVPGAPFESRANALNGQSAFELFCLGDVSQASGAQLQARSANAGVTEFLRPEDGAWDLDDPASFYFATTDRFDGGGLDGRSRLWRLRFHSLARPELGGVIEMLLDGTEGQQMLDNLTLDRRGHVLLQEDPGSNVHLARIWQYTLATDTLTLLAEHAPALFTPGSPSFLTTDEESSGIVDARHVLGPGWFLLGVQAGFALPGPLVRGGQLLALFNPASQ